MCLAETIVRRLFNLFFDNLGLFGFYHRKMSVINFSSYDLIFGNLLGPKKILQKRFAFFLSSGSGLFFLGFCIKLLRT